MHSLNPTYHKIQLPKTTLHYMRVGTGEPLVIVPATISYLDDWLTLVQFVGQYYETYFFELPGHGLSTPFMEPYSSDLVAETVESFLDALGLQRISLLGFSFGGILVLKTLQRLQDRVTAVFLLAPCVGHHSLRHSLSRQKLFRLIVSVFRTTQSQQCLLQIIHNKTMVHVFVRFLTFWGKVEPTTSLYDKLGSLPLSTLTVLIGQIEEILTVQFPNSPGSFLQPCFLGMSIYDPLLNFNTVHQFLKDHFSSLHTIRFTFPYHQPPRPLTFAEYNRDYGHLITRLVAQTQSKTGISIKNQPTQIINNERNDNGQGGRRHCEKEATDSA